MKNLTFFRSMLLIVLCFGMISLDAQLTLPDLSPRSQITQNVGFGEVHIDYSRPSMRGRVIFGELVPFGKVWRTGANDATLINFSDDVFINEKEVPKGTYSLFTIPGEKVWTIILNKEVDLWGPYNYSPAHDFMRFNITPKEVCNHVETFTIDIGEVTQTTANVMISWENTMAKFQIGTDADDRIISQIDKKLRNPMADVAGTYYSSANYYLETHRDLDKAMEWADKAIEIGGETGFNLLLKAKIYAETENYQKAIQFAKKSLEQARAKDNGTLVMVNEQLIEKWKKMPSGH